MSKIFANNFLKIDPIKGKNEDLEKNTLNRAFPAMFFRLDSDGRLFLEFDPSLGALAISPKDFGATPMQYLRGGSTSVLSSSHTVSTHPVEFTMPFMVPITSWVAKPVKAQSLIVDEFFPGVSPGPFDRRFPQLASWVGKKQNRSPNILLEDIQLDIEGAAESFEVLGVKIPLSLIAKMGVLILVAIETYFCLHLRNLNQLLLRNNKLPSFPWIGIYPDRSSKSVFVFRVVGAPTAIVIWLFVNSWDQLTFSALAALGFSFVMIQVFLILQLYSFWKIWYQISVGCRK